MISLPDVTYDVLMICTAEVLRKSIVTLHTAMWIVGKLEVANEACIEGCTQIDCYGDSVSSWDQAVALYFGTNTGEQMSYHDADKYCKYFGTCGENQEILEGTAQINYKVMDLYRMGQSMIVEGRCSELLSIKEQIETLMIVPNIQGTLRNIWKGHDNNMKGETAKIEKHRGEAIAYTLALLPLVHACSAADAELVYTTIFTADLNLESYQVVKDALEKNYDCLGVECSDVGGFTGKSAEGYMDFHLPCGVILEESSSSDEDQLQASMAKEETSSSKLGVGLGVGIPLGLALLGVIAWTATKRTKSEPIKGDSMTASDVEASEPSVKHPEKSIN